MGARLRWAVLTAVILAALDDFFYLSQIVRPPGQLGDLLIYRQAFVAVFIAIMAMAAALSLRTSADRWRGQLLSLSSIGLLAMGYIGMFSIGLPLFAAGLLCLLALIVNLSASGQRVAVLKAAAGALLALLIFFGGLELTAQAIKCPARGFEGGTGSSFFGGPYHYWCVDGKLTIRPGDCTHMGASMDPNGHVTAVTDC